MSYKLESILTYVIFAVAFSVAIIVYIFLCHKYKNNKKIYKCFALAPYAEMVLSLFFLVLSFLDGFVSNFLMPATIGFMLLPFIHLFVYYCCVPYWNTKIPRDKKISCCISLLFYVAILLGLLYCLYSGVLLFGFGKGQPTSIELIHFERSEGLEETTHITEQEDILEIYNAICHAQIHDVQFDSEGLETDGDWVIILHFEDEDISLCTQGEGMKDSIYFRRYPNQNDSQKFIEYWLDNSMLIGRLQDYK